MEFSLRHFSYEFFPHPKPFVVSNISPVAILSWTSLYINHSHAFNIDVSVFSINSSLTLSLQTGVYYHRHTSNKGMLVRNSKEPKMES